MDLLANVPAPNPIGRDRDGDVVSSGVAVGRSRPATGHSYPEAAPATGTRARSRVTIPVAGGACGAISRGPGREPRRGSGVEVAR